MSKPIPLLDYPGDARPTRPTAAPQPDGARSARWAATIERLDPRGRKLAEAAIAELGAALLDISSRRCPACDVQPMILLKTADGSGAIFGCLSCGRDLESALRVKASRDQSR